MEYQSELLDHITDLFEEIETGQGVLAIFIINIQNLNDINATYGAGLAGELIRRVEQRINHVLRPIDRLARLADDEFCVVLPALTNSSHAILAANKIIDEFHLPFIFDAHQIQPKIVMGISTDTGVDINYDALVQDAISALLEAEKYGEKYRIHISKQENEVPSRIMLENEMRYAHEHEEFSLFYQPKIDIINEKLLGAEALIRWFSPRYGHVETENFIDILDESDILMPVTKWIINMALRQCLEFQKSDENFTISVNLSPALLKSDEVVELITGAAKIWGVKPSNLIVEVTEEAIAKYHNTSIEVINALHRQGIGISIDDFGTGHTSLSILKDLPVTELKIDKMFVMNMQSDVADRRIVKAVIELAHTFEMSVVAEGVETETCYKLLREIGCDGCQGFYIAKPMTDRDFKKWLLESNFTKK